MFLSQEDDASSFIFHLSQDYFSYLEAFCIPKEFLLKKKLLFLMNAHAIGNDF